MTSIRGRLTLHLSAAIGLLFLLTGAGIVLTMRHRLYSQLDGELATKAAALIAAAEVDDGDFEIDSSIQDFAGFRKGGDYFEVRRSSGKTIERSTPDISIRDLPEHDPQHPLEATATLDGKPGRFLIRRFIPDDDDERQFPDLILIVASPLSPIRNQLRLLTVIIAIAGALAIIATIFIVKNSLSRGLKPLGQLSDDIQSIRPDNLGQRLSVSGLPAELTPIAGSLNSWLDRLKASFDRERRFSSHAAHELRTPLSELRALAETASLFPEEATPQRFREMLEISDELAALLDKLSLLSRTDAGRQPVASEPVDLPALIATSLERNQAKATAKNLRIHTDTTPSPFNSDPTLWTSIIQNLIGNAISHAPENSGITIRSSPGRLTVGNPAPDLSPGDLETLFERFWRKDASHSGYEHSGLGLSIVRACANAMGGTCRATLSADHLLEIEVITSPHTATTPAP